MDRRDQAISAERMSQAFRIAGITGHYRRRLMGSRSLWLLGVGSAVGGVSKSEFCDNLASRFVSERKRFLRCLDNVAVALAEVGDADGDGRIGPEEFLTLMESGFGVPRESAHRAFARLDLDGSGYLEHGEIQKAVRDFFTPCDRDRPGNWLLGPPPWSRSPSEGQAGADAN